MSYSAPDLRLMERLYVQKIPKHQIPLPSEPQRNTETVWIHLIIVALVEEGGRRGRGEEGGRRGGEGGEEGGGEGGGGRGEGGVC